MSVQPRDVQWTGTGGISDTQSYAWILLNAIYERVANSSFFADFAVKIITEALPLDPGFQIPSVGVFVGREEWTPDGDPGAGCIRFKHSIPIGFQIVVKNNDPALMQQVLDQAKWFILNQLFRDDTLTNFWRTNLPDNCRFQVTRVTIPHPIWGTVGAKNETPVGIQDMVMAFQFLTDWYPTDFPDLERITVRTGFPGPGSTPEEQQQVQQVTMVYEFDPDAVPHPLPPDTDPPTPFANQTGDGNARTEPEREE